MIAARSSRRPLVDVALLLSLLLAFAPAPVAASARFGEVTAFATVPFPGHPEGIIVDGPHVLVTTTVWAGTAATGDGEPSRLFSFDRRTGELRHEVKMVGEDTGTLHGAAGVILDRRGRRYVALSPYPHPATGRTGAAVVRMDRRGRQELYALIPDLPPCTPLAAQPCSPAAGDRAPLANDVVFDAEGNLYVSDSFQATVWRVPPGGGVAQPWLQGPELDGLLVGPNGLRVGPSGEELYLAVMANVGAIGTIYRVPLVDRPTVDDLVVHHRWVGESPDGITFGRSGRLYVVLGEGVVSVLEPDGTETHRISSPLFHNPASPAFDDATRSLLVTNHSFDDDDPSAQTVVRVTVDDTGLPLVRPRL